jgi:hypothetical protein
VGDASLPSSVSGGVELGVEGEALSGVATAITEGRKRSGEEGLVVGDGEVGAPPLPVGGRWRRRRRWSGG